MQGKLNVVLFQPETAEGHNSSFSPEPYALDTHGLAKGCIKVKMLLILLYI